uniref:Putative esterase mutated n=1 Tax=Saccharopolyspora erythraea TaxID=1836 RepID=Q04794_SACER|nr:putative esterase mutated [Saccharopolyspora erythraea NRRL 2338]
MSWNPPPPGEGGCQIQKTPVVFDGELTLLPMGQYLHRALGGDYVALAATHTGTSAPEIELDDSSDSGFAVREVDLPAPEDGSIEAAAVAARIGTGLVDLRAQAPGLDRIRSQSTWMRTPLRDAFDAVLTVPTATAEVSTPRPARD